MIETDDGPIRDPITLGEALTRWIGTQERVRREALRCLREGRTELAAELLEGPEDFGIDDGWFGRAGLASPTRSDVRGDSPGPRTGGRRPVRRRLEPLAGGQGFRGPGPG